jgi:hypothetical protein
MRLLCVTHKDFILENNESMRDGLNHIIKVCRMARTQSRRTRWIESRARSAANNDDDWRYADLPKHAPDYKAIVERLRQTVTTDTETKEDFIRRVAEIIGDT